MLGTATDKYALLSVNFPRVEALDVPITKKKLYGTNLVGLFCVGNSNGFLVPSFISDDEIERLEISLGEGINVGRIMDRCTALGNLISCNDNAAIVSPMISETKAIRKVLGVKIVQVQISGHDEVGACCVATNKGFLVHPDAENELRKLSKIFKVEGLTGSVNFGFPFVKSGLIANSNGYIAGSRTTGIELGRIDEALGFLD